MHANLPLSSKLPHITPIIPVYLIIITVSFTIYHYILFSNTLSYNYKLPIIFLFFPLSTMVLITHLKCMFTSPGFVPIPYTPIKQITIEQNPKRSEIYCKKCNNPRPSRSHHCKICNKCVLKMDHHCQWIANCVGHNNQKFFYQFLFYATFGNAIALIIIVFRLYEIDYHIQYYVPKGTKISNVFQLIWYMWEPIQLIIGCLCSFAMVIGIGKLFHKQTGMLLNNQTTIDMLMFPDWEKSPYYSQDKWNNFMNVMGKDVIEWLMLSVKEYDEYKELNERNVTMKGNNYYNLDEIV